MPSGNITNKLYSFLSRREPYIENIWQGNIEYWRIGEIFSKTEQGTIEQGEKIYRWARLLLHCRRKLYNKKPGKEQIGREIINEGKRLWTLCRIPCKRRMELFLPSIFCAFLVYITTLTASHRWLQWLSVTGSDLLLLPLNALAMGSLVLCTLDKDVSMY